MDVRTVSTIGQALADPTRLEVLGLCGGKLAVGQIAETLGVTSATVSHHLRLLERARLVEVIRRGRRTMPRRLPDGWRVLASALD